jgi:PTS system nitrogen regulatory IIA component
VKGSKHVEASFIRLKKPLPFDAVDSQPVDLLFCLAVPEDCGEDHLKLLAQVAELFSDPDLLRQLREATTSGQLMQLLSGSRH